jgi:hypothetical protein
LGTLTLIHTTVLLTLGGTDTCASWLTRPADSGLLRDNVHPGYWRPAQRQPDVALRG